MARADQLPAWEELRRLRQSWALDLRAAFQQDSGRAQRWQFEAAGVRLDLSKNLWDEAVWARLLRLAEQAEVLAQRDAMLRGEAINNTEGRAVLHTALRAPAGAAIPFNAEVQEALERMLGYAEQVRASGIRDVVHIGIGGSDLGPAMAVQALQADLPPHLRLHFVSNVDGQDLAAVLPQLQPQTTLFIVASKTFTTQETMTNARTARDWLVSGLGGDTAAVARHFVAISTNAAKVAEFGIDTANMFGFWDWVGGRYSMSSAIGLSTMIAVGPDQFGELLAGLHAMDVHFRTAEPRQNLPLLHGLLCVWNRNFLGAADYVVLPYDQYLERFPAYLQQMIMESNGKRVTADGAPVDYDTSASFWGEPGTNGQHSFYQMLHQGTTIVPADFIFFARPINDVGPHHDLLVANCLAQAGVMAFGRTAAEVEADGTPAHLVEHKVMPGNRPNSTLLADDLTPFTLGALIALYEHSTFVQGMVWDLNPYDQWGVQLGKVVADSIAPMLTGGVEASLDSSTNDLIARYRSARGR